jgi:hypothetical protein
MGLSALLLLFAGCEGYVMGDATSGTGEETESVQMALAASNGLTVINGLSVTNGLSVVNGLNVANGLAVVNGLSVTNGLMTTTDGRKTVEYIARCALAANDSLIKKDQNGASYTFRGAIGLAPQWKNGACDGACQEAVSACILAHVNTTGRHIGLWLTAPMSPIGWGRDYRFQLQEGAFFGNIFQSPPRAYYCNGYDWDRGPVAGRIGAASGSPYVNPFGSNGLCQNSCSKVNDGYTSCAGFSRVVTVFRDFDPGKPYFIRNTQTNLAMDISGSSTSAGTPLLTYNYTNKSNQKFFFERVGTGRYEGPYRIRAMHSNLYLTATGGSTAANSGISQQPSTGGDEQRWYMTAVYGSTYIIENVKSRLLIGNNGNFAPGAPAVQTPTWNGSYNPTQSWRLALSP